MKQKFRLKKIDSYAVAHQTLTDCFDEYREEITALRQRPDDKARCTAVQNKIARRCSREGQTLLRLLPWKEKEHRGFWAGGILLRLLSVLAILAAAGCVVQAIRLGYPALWLALAASALTVNRIVIKTRALLCDLLVWNILKKDYQPQTAKWSDDQRSLLPARLLPYAAVLSGSVDPENCIRCKIHCSCGREKFRVWRHPKQGYLRATCASCGEEIVLFDEHIDSYHADGEAQHFLTNTLQMAMCRSCGSDTQQVILSVASDEQRSFFRKESNAGEADSGYCLMYQMFCTSCGEPSGDGIYFWCREWEQEEIK